MSLDRSTAGFRIVPGDDRGWAGLTAIKTGEHTELVVCRTGPTAEAVLTKDPRRGGA